MSENNIKPINNCGGLSLSEIPNVYNLGYSMEQQILILMKKTNEIIFTFNNVINDKIDQYVEGRINELFIDSIYDSSTETLRLYITHE